MSVSNQFTTPGARPHHTPVHRYPLPPEGRQFRPTYSGGRYKLPDPDTGRDTLFTRVTTGAHALEDTSSLDRWKMGNVVLGLKDQPELLDSLDLFADPADVRKNVRRVADKASQVAGADQASELGTAIHAWTEAVERDGVAVDDVPGKFRPYIEAYLHTLSAAGVSTVPDMVERIVYSSTTGWVGTLDRIYQLADGTQVIGDVKTSKTLDFSYLSFATQLACYATADYMLSLDGTQWEPMPAVGDVYGVIAHVPSNQPGHCELVTMDLRVGMQALELAYAVIQARRVSKVDVVNTWELPRPMDYAALRAKVLECTTAPQLAQLWEDHQDIWTDDLTQLGYSRLS